MNNNANKNGSFDDLPIDASKDTLETVSSTTDNSTTDGSAERTPTGQGISSYQDIALSPGSLIAFSIARKRINGDGILDKLSAKSSLNNIDIRLIYFLYGKEYCWSPHTLAERLEKIELILSTKEYRERLSIIALSEVTEKNFMWDESRNEEHFNWYVATDLAAKLFFGGAKPQKVGGFVAKFGSTFRFQQGKNCYSVAACMWATLQFQFDMPDNPKVANTIDTAQFARHNIVTNDQALEDRVIKNKGGSAMAMVEKLTGRSMANRDFVEIDTTKERHWKHQVARERLGYDILYQRKELGFGLVSGFKVNDAFRATAREFEKKFLEAKERGDPPPVGYWKLEEGDEVGEFVEIGTNELFQEAKDSEEMRKLWDESNAQVMEEKNGVRDIVGRHIGTGVSPKRLRFDSPNAAGTTNGSESISSSALPGSGDAGEEVAHSMVLLGGFMEEGDDGEKKYYFMLLNWWAKLPLVLCSLEYLKDRGATLYFVEMPLTEDLADKPSRRPARMAEASCFEERYEEAQFTYKLNVKYEYEE